MSEVNISVFAGIPKQGNAEIFHGQNILKAVGPRTWEHFHEDF